ncbi:MAG: helix-turn-helix domain-containing protein, partial [Gemmataceae bacterium]
RGTGFDEVEHWRKWAKVPSARLQVIRIDDLESPQISQLLGRVCLAFGPEGRGGIIDAALAGDSLLVRGPRQRLLTVPVASLSALKGLPREVLRDFEVDPDGSFLHWPGPDVHLGWEQFLQAVHPGELLKGRQRTEGYNRRYGDAIRRLREAAGITQSGVEGITERQLRRVERGECRATLAALGSLAKAHGVSVNEYLDAVARGMGKPSRVAGR